MFSTLVFYPTLTYNLLRNYLQPQSWAWYTKIDDTLIVGALPFKSMIDNLKKVENVGGVVCCVEDFELKAAWNGIRPEDWSSAGVKFHHIPMRDFTGTATRKEMDAAVRFIDSIASEGKTCYVHCKAGRTRSAAVATCYLMRKCDYLPNVAFSVIQEKRPQVIMRNAQWRTVNEFRRFLDGKTSEQNTK